MPPFITPNIRGPVVRQKDIEEDIEELYTVLGYDPGGTTGWAAIGVYKEAILDPEFRITDNIAFWTAGEFIGNEEDQVDCMIALTHAWPEARIVCEDFVLRKFNSARELLSPVRITAMFRYGIRDSNRAIILQQPSLAMTAVTDARLKKLGFWPPLSGQEHARDAVRHAFTWLRRAKKLQEVRMISDAMLNA